MSEGVGGWGERVGWEGGNSENGEEDEKKRGICK